MRCTRVLAVLFGCVALARLSSAGDAKPKPSAIELRRFSVAEGAAFPQEFPDFLYALLMEKLQEARLDAVILGENEVPDTAGSAILVLEGKMLAAKGAWYRGAGEKKLSAEVTLRSGTARIVWKKDISAGPSVWTRVSYEDENELWSAAALADRIVKEIRTVLKR